MFKRILYFFNIKYISKVIMVMLLLSAFQYFYLKNNFEAIFFIVAIPIFIITVFLSNEQLFRNIKYIKTGNIEDATDSILTNEYKLVKQARLKQNVLFVPGEEKYFYHDNNYRVLS